MDSKSENMINIKVNGDEKSVPEGMNVDELQDYFKVKKQAAVVEHNRKVLRQKENKDVQVVEGDVIEIVKFVGGG